MSAKIKSRPDNEGNPQSTFRALRARSPERAGGSAKFSPRRLPYTTFVESLSCSVKVPQRWQRNERFQWAYRSRAANDIFPARGMNLSRFLGRSRFQGGCLRL